MAGLGISLSSRAQLSAAKYAELAGRAEAAGFEAVFATETSSDCMPIAQAMIHETSSIAVGTAIANIYWRHPCLTAATAATLSRLSAGRFMLGLGTGNAALNHDQLGLPRTPPLATMREHVTVVRDVLAGETTTHHGEVYHVNGFTPTVADHPPVPIYVGALLPRMVSLAATAGDGVLLNLASAGTVARSVALIRETLQSQGRDASSFRVLCLIPTTLSDDEASSVSAAREVVAGYSMHPAANRLFASAAREGTDLAEVARVARERGVTEAAELVDEELANDLVITRRPLERLQDYRDAGVDLPILFPVAVGGDWTSSIDAALSVPTP